MGWTVPSATGHCATAPRDVPRARDPVDEPRPLGQLGLQRDAVEAEPARPRGLRPRGVDRDDLEVHALAETDERVVRPHRDVLAARLRRDAGDLGDVLDAVGERRGGDDEVIERRERRGGVGLIAASMLP